MPIQRFDSSVVAKSLLNRNLHPISVQAARKLFGLFEIDPGVGAQASPSSRITNVLVRFEHHKNFIKLPISHPDHQNFSSQPRSPFFATKWL
jgi:hypothetical protein